MAAQAKRLRLNAKDWLRKDGDAEWLGSFQKIQLARLITELKGAEHAPAPERKKSELVDTLAKLFSDAAQGKLEDKKVADAVNGWIPTNLREEATNSD